MAPVSHTIPDLIPISRIGGRFLLFDIDVVTYLRRDHNICGVLVGGIPQVPQQNIFLGLPVELFPEEALLLVEKQVAYIVDDTVWHQTSFGSFHGEDKRSYLASLREEGRKAQRSAAKGAQKRAEYGLAKQAVMRASKEKSRDKSEKTQTEIHAVLFEDPDSGRPQSPSQALTASTSVSSFTTSSFSVTSTTTCSPASIPQKPSLQDSPSIPVSYPLYAHLHARDYFITPGLRFGCDYTVYPGDPLRYHSHFLAVGYDWEQEIPLMDLIGGGRLGTGVKKGFLVGGKDPRCEAEQSGEDVRTFCIEWGGM